MIEVFNGETANDVYISMAEKLLAHRVVSLQPSRSGSVWEILHVGLSITNPRERWVVSRLPPINPAFAIAEVIWIINGRNDAAFLNYWNRRLPQFAGNETNYHGSYGYRLKHHFGVDQLDKAYKALLNNPDSRQVVLQIWDVKSDFPSDDGLPVSSDIPCNIISLLKIRDGKLEWTQVIRSNDIYRGLPYNLIQFTTLQEVLAGWLGIEIGSYNQLSDSLHLYSSDTPTFSVEASIKIEKNADCFDLPKPESERMFALLSKLMDQITKPGIDRKALVEIFRQQELYAPYRNLIILVAAEIARRNRWSTVEFDLIANCSNPLLVQVWNRWKNLPHQL